MLGDFPQDARHVRGFPRKDISIDAEEVDERAFLFGGKHGANAHHFTLGATEVYEDLLDTLRGLPTTLAVGSGCERIVAPLLLVLLFGGTVGGAFAGVLVPLGLAFEAIEDRSDCLLH